MPVFYVKWYMHINKCIPACNDVGMVLHFHFSVNRIINFFKQLTYTGWAKKVSLLIFAITLSTASLFSYFLSHMRYRKLATGRYIVCPPNMVCVTTLPCEILRTTLSLCLYVFATVIAVHIGQHQYDRLKQQSVSGRQLLAIKRLIRTISFVANFRRRIGHSSSLQ